MLNSESVACSRMEKKNKPKRARQANFSILEEVTLISSVISNYDGLFGSFTGSSRGVSVKQEAWRLVLDAVNAASVSERTLDGIEKKFNNIKQSAKGKRDEKKHPPTGGGREPVYTPAEEMWVNALEERKNPTLHGVFGGVDVNELNTYNENIVQPFDFTEENGYTFSIDQQHIPVILDMPERLPLTTERLPLTTNLSNVICETTNSRDVRRKRKKISEDKDSLELDILRMEKEKLALETEYMRQKLSCLEQRKSLWILKENFYKKFLSSPED